MQDPVEAGVVRRPIARQGAEESAIDLAVLSAERLSVLGSTALLDSPTEEPYDRISRLASRMMRAPIATVTLLDRDRQFYKACVGIPEPLSSTRETPLEYSFCKHTIALGTPLVITDTLQDARVNEMPSVTQFNVRAYAGVPLLVAGQAVGTLCVMDLRSRDWSDEDIDTLIDLAATVMTEIKLRMTVTELEIMGNVANVARRDAEQANRAKGEFLAMISHDLRTPLTAIGGYSQLLETGVPGPVTDAQMKMLTRIRAAQGNLENLISEVLAFSKLEAGSDVVSLSDFSVTSVLTDVQALVRPQLEAKSVLFTYQGPDFDVTITADEGKLKRILMNLLTNATKFTPQNGEVTLAWRAENASIVFNVIDTGIGISPERIASIFDPFVQVPGQKAINPDGVGLGLSIAMRLSKVMNGTLSATSELGRGTAFELWLPVAPSAR